MLKNFKFWVENNKVDHRKYKVNMEVTTSSVNNAFVLLKLYEKEKKDGLPTIKIIDYSVDVCRSFFKKYDSKKLVNSFFQLQI